VDERAVLEGQIEELLGEGISDGSDALELAMVAGLAARLGASPEALAVAAAWRRGPGQSLLAEIWSEVDVDEYVDAIEGLLTADADAEAVEEAVFDFDDLVAAAVWSGAVARVRAACRMVARHVRDVPEVFAPLRPFAVAMARSPAVAEHLELYDYWLALADVPA
jgi:hypothetical protein